MEELTKLLRGVRRCFGEGDDLYEEDNENGQRERKRGCGFAQPTS